ncbi:zinc ribbon domain-containing protein [Pseudonocardia sp. KRD-184]|uniref:Zinc ribbon domain-containing protein n=1 Tax=Pseudonocardia oceani TaxID=2792013 RepID=A0ABS6U857_9PSEU|nr:zinc ribbon domain-containing protein [Pseudonocardia oceani]MBW0091537.1 zinc ribbon domain-containing protein [Pseudonocardia oceani]MBW0098658.1 zinc ribbon domain-containing protein [Pseudonocardia oceani]MBW0111185.1 zinc ribbon domain-containing protein [Pseudonocardia oceani]MBW0124133.1 zinc ribbon domain-containing protein [Pseudonocardia oceani]MBW0128141.1 zinc ribbon domain-containing protein [Pseudonocardia oceani]
MPIYVFKCECEYRFEYLASFDAAAPACPECGGATRKIPAGFSLGGQASAGLTKEQMPQTWKGTYNGDREYVTKLRRQWDKRQQVEAKHPEIAGDQRPIIAHEGRYHAAPLRAGDVPLGGAAGHATAPRPAADDAAAAAPPSTGHGHGHGGHGHGHGHATKPTTGSTGASPAGGSD